MIVNKFYVPFLIAVVVLSGCKKNYTNFYEDTQAPGLSIFSDKENNVLSCYINGMPWRTPDRSQILGAPIPSGIKYELYITKKPKGGQNDTLNFSWIGYFDKDNLNYTYLTLTLSVKKDFKKLDLSDLSGQRITIDSTINGYFSSNVNGMDIQLKGNGSVYFHKASYNSTGAIAGLFEATINGVKFTKGRFDEELNNENVLFE